MVRVAYLAAAMVIAGATEAVGASAVLQDAYAQAWFWTPPRASERTRSRKRGPGWFWSFKQGASDERPTPTQLLFFSGSDLWRHGAFLHGGMLWTPAGLDHDGFVVKLTASRGYYRYRSGALGTPTVTGTMFAVSVMPGVRFTRGGVTATVYVGVDHQIHLLQPDDRANAARGRQTGMRLAADLWYQPTALTMITASSTVSTIGYGYAARAAFGWRMLDRFYVGPEAIVYGAGDYRQFRIGAHITGLELISLEWQAAVGYAADDDGVRGVYLRLGVSNRW